MLGNIQCTCSTHCSSPQLIPYSFTVFTQLETLLLVETDTLDKYVHSCTSTTSHHHNPCFCKHCFHPSMKQFLSEDCPDHPFGGNHAYARYTKSVKIYRTLSPPFTLLEREARHETNTCFCVRPVGVHSSYAHLSGTFLI